MKMPDLPLPVGVVFHAGDSAGEVALALAEAVAGRLGSCLQQLPEASLVVSGGSTPLPFFRALSGRELDWQRVNLLLADERWVDEADPASNTRLVKETLLQGPAASARFLSLKQPGARPEDGMAGVRRELAHLPLPVDVLVLGMGNDGHTASLFPDAPELASAMDPSGRELVAAMTPASQVHRRITLTLPVLGNARHTFLHLKGADKLDTLRQALDHPRDVMAMPIRAFLKLGLQVFWSP